MKTVTKNKEKKSKNNKKTKIKPKKEKVLLVAQEIKFARLLCGNEKKTRDRVLKTFKKWLLNCFDKGYEFKEDDFSRIWKGLFYAVWMSDKPLVQEDLCETISGILDLFPPQQLKYALMMIKAGFKVLALEWYGIDHHRMDKFLMLIRRYLRGSLRCLRRCEWNLKSCQMYSDMVSGTDGILALKTPSYARNANSMLMHYIDCFLEELSKVSEGDIPAASMTALLRPFCVYMCKGESPALCVSARRVLTALLRQSEHGLLYQHKTKAWEMMGCPRGGPDALELVSDDDDEEEQIGDVDEEREHETALDPRAGRVNVELNPLPVPAKQIAQMLKELLATTASKAYKRTKICLQRFEQLAKDEYPLRVPDVYTDEDEAPKPNTLDAARDLHILDNQLVHSADELALRGLSRKHRKRLLAKSRAGLSIVEDIEAVKGKIDGCTNGNWEVETTEPELNDKLKNCSDKENVNKDKKSNKRKLSDEQTDTNNKKQKFKHEKGQKNTNKDTIKRSYEKKTNKNKNKIKKQKILNGIQDIKLVPKLSDATKKQKESKTENVEPNKNNKNQKKLKTDTEAKQPDNNAKKPLTPHTNQTNTNKVLVKSNKINGDTNVNPKKRDHRQQKQVEIGKEKKTSPSVIINKVKNYQKKTSAEKSPLKNGSYETPKKVKFVLKNNSMQGPVDYYKSVRQSPSIPFDSTKKPSKTNLKVSTPSPINPFLKKKLRIK
ncbi:unnamed protein product [Diatraea saccharalis]|uniref:Ribosomal RNA processing protein 1 homolog n=1 Tax=Diatraea saccharalis TaxID=40085 RepID=A0A9N9RCY1_9NEOP|nr:unnamed protein product [Diatraea saccharalis]